MRSRFATILAFVTALGLVLPLGGCESSGTNQTVGTVGGAAAGGILGGVIGHAVGGRSGTVVGALAGAALGGWGGSIIGKRLDDADRQRAQSATLSALEQPVTPAARSTAASRQTTQRTATTGGAAGQSVLWESTSNPDVRGSSQVVGTSQSTSGQQCRDVREVAYIRGEEVTQTTRYCRNQQGRWAQA